MKKLTIGFHVLFWLFIALYDFDYLIDLHNLPSSIGYASLETSIYALEFYINLLILLPIISKKYGQIAYGFSILVLLSFACSLYFLFGIDQTLLGSSALRSILSFLLNHSLFILISFFVWYFKQFQQEKQRRLELENKQLQSELLLLKSQINPHFLFNALNNIYSLTLLKSDDAPKMLATLSDILRYLIYDGGKKTVLLATEIEIIEKYIAIQQFRKILGKDNIHFSVIGDYSTIQVPPLIFINLVENIFKHSDIAERTDSFVEIQFTINELEISYKSTNSFQPKAMEAGIGLKNTISQMDLLFGDRYQLFIGQENNVYQLNLSFNGTR